VSSVASTVPDRSRRSRSFASFQDVGYPSRVIPFPVTHLSVLERVRSQDASVRRLAFDDLARAYWKPAYHYMRLHWSLSPEAAEDAVQAFFTTAFEKQYLERYDVDKAKFRTFLRVCLDRFVQNLRKADAARRRGGGAPHLSLDFPGAEQELTQISGATASDAERFFHDETVRFLFSRAVESLKLSLERDGRAVIYRVFELHDLSPGPETTYATVSSALGISVTQVTNHLHAARRRFREVALEQLRAMSASEDEYRREARDLFGLDVS
jgi:RNA polymerase sigma factor (sigma-70 family)